MIVILDVLDSNGNTWYEVPNLAQENVFNSIRNTNVNDPNWSIDPEVPYLLELKSVERRFATRFLNERNLQLQFGAGSTRSTTEQIIPNPDNVGLGLPFEKTKLTTAFSPVNFVFTNPDLSNTALANTIFNSISSNNPLAADGGMDGDTIEEIRQNSLGNFQNQLRTVTTQDYLVRALSMPSNLGVIAKAHAQPQKIGR